MIDILRGGVAVAFLLSFAIFIHELGHFLFAKLFRVKVETFSIGFGKKIWKIRRGETEYCLSAIPLGGYVKMVGIHSKEMEKIIAGDEPASAEDEAAAELAAAELAAPAPVSMGQSIVNEVDALRSKAYWQKFLVFSAGCINNFLTAVCVFFFMDFIGHHWAQPTPPVVEIVENVDLAGSGVQAGDKVVKIGKHSVEDFNELQSRWMDATKNEPVPKFIKLDVERAGTTQTVEVPTEPPVGTQLPAGQIVQINDVKVSNEKAVTKAIANLLTLAKLDPIRVVVRTRDNQEFTTTVPVLAAVGKDWPLFAWQPRQPAFVAQPLPNLPAEKAGVRVGDEIVSVAGVPVSSAVRATREIRKHLGETIPIEVKRGTEKKGFETVKLDVEVRPHPDNPKLGQIGIAFGAGPPTQFIKKPFGEAFRGAFQKAGLFVLLYVDGIQDLLKSSFQTLRESVGGPIAIGTQAYKAANEGWPYFFWLFATFNIILAVTNLLPLPVFDGGHILFSTIEAIIRRPLPAKFMLFVYQTFTFLIIGLALVITFNDVVMNWWRLR